MNAARSKLPWLLLPLALAACVPAAFSPTTAVMPTPGKPLQIFAAEQAACQQFAEQQIAAARAQINSQIAGGVLMGMALGAGQAAAFGGDTGAVIAGAASTGAAVGGANVPNAQFATAALQQQYDGAYSQCMYAQGNQVPGYAAAYPGPEMSRRRVRHQRRTVPQPQGEAAAAGKIVEPPAVVQPVSAPVIEPPPAAR
jgi:hypothetical protein